MKDQQRGYYRDIELDADGNHIFESRGIAALYQNNPINFALAVHKGLIPGIEAFTKFGRNPLINTTSDPEDIWNGGGLYSGFPAESETLEIFSDDANDTDGGTGARTVLITNLLDENHEMMDPITVTLNGTTPVSLGGQTYHRCSRAWVMSTGSGGSNAGELTIRHTTTVANIFAVVPIGLNQTQIFAYTVPMGYTLIIPNFTVKIGRAGGTPGSANIQVKTKERNGGIWRVIRNIEVTDSSGYDYRSTAFFILDEGYDIKATVATVSDNSTAATGEADGYLISNTLYPYLFI